MTYASASRHTAGLMMPRHVDILMASGLWCGDSTGAANAQIIAPPFASSLSANPRYSFRAGYTNTGAVTLSADGGVTNTSLRKADGTAMAGGEIVSGTAYQVVFDGTYWRLIGGAGAASWPVTSKGSSYSAVSADFGTAIKFTASATLTLPAASGLSSGAPILVMNRAGSSASISVITTGTDTINGASAFVVRPGSDCIIIRSASGAYEVTSVGQSVYDSTGAWSPVYKGASITLTNGNLTATGTGGGYGSVLATLGASAGKKYFEVRAAVASGLSVGIGKINMGLTGPVGDDANGWSYLYDGRKVNGGVPTAYSSTFADNDVIGIAWDADAGKLWVRVNGVWQGSGDPVAGTNPMFTGVTGTLYPAVGDSSNSSAPSGTLILSPSSFANAAPTGYSAFY